MKSTMKQWLLVAILLVSLALAGCSFAPAPSTPGAPTPDAPTVEEDLGIRAVYVSYVAYAEKNQEKPLSYEDWLASIRGEDGVTPTVVIDENGYWVINGVKTVYKAIGQDGAPGKDGAPGVTPTIEISEDGYWVINGVKSDKKATGADGKDGVSISSVTVDEAGRLVITLSNGTTLDPIQLPVGNVHEHTLGEWQIVGGGNTCDECFFIAACNDCGEIKWRMGTEADHKYDTPVSVESTCTQQGYVGVRCSVCGDVKITEYRELAEHSWSTEYTMDVSHHWLNCQNCSARNEFAEHDFSTSKICPTCSYSSYGAEYPWETTTLFFQMSDNSNNNDLTSGCRRYLAGVTNDNTNLDEMIDERNAKARLNTKTQIVYDYWEESTGVHTWSKDIAEIVELTKTAASTAAPDMYCTFVYDMVGAMLQGCFANTLSDMRGTNYFRFLEDDYSPYTDDEGYMYEYMTSLTLSSRRMYLVASDYFTDLVRAFFVVPVNMKLLTENATEVTGDRDGDGDSDFDDLIAIVEAGGWNYELVMEYCEAVGEESVESNKIDLGGRVGFALDAYSGLSSSGMLYTTPITIIERKGSVVTDYEYSYPETHPELVAFAENIAELMSTNGAYVVSSGKSGLSSIRDAFATNHVLFGGVVCVGSLEDDVYQNMRDQDGFGVVPVPLYRSVNPETNKPDEYLTQIHNVGRIGAIAKNTTKFSQCTAYLNYLSLNSTDILNEYYDWIFSMGAIAGTSSANGNVKMLQSMRANVGSGFDKVFEEALSIYAEMSGNLWHKVIQNGGTAHTGMQTEPYRIGSNMASVYEQLYDVKKYALNTLWAAFEEFDDDSGSSIIPPPAVEPEPNPTEPMSFSEYVQAADDTEVLVQGIVSGIASKADGDAANILYLQDINGEGGYYVYGLSVDPVADLGLAIGMKATVSGIKDTYNGIYEVVNASVEEFNTEIVPLTPLDFTEIFKNASATDDKALTEKQSALVTVKGVELYYEENTNGYYGFKMGELKSYIRISKANNCIPTAEIDAFRALHTQNVGRVVDVTGILQIYDGAFYLIPTDACEAIANVSLPERTDAEKVALEMDGIRLGSEYTEDTDVMLPLVGFVYPEVAMRWVSDSANAIVGADGTLAVTIPEIDTAVNLTVTVVCGNETLTKTFTLNLISNAAPVEVTIPEALALADGTSVIVRGTVKSIEKAYNSVYDNISVIIEDAEGNTLYVFRLVGNWNVGDSLVITGKMDTYKEERQIAQGATAEKVVDEPTDEPTNPPAGGDNDDPATPPATGTNVVFTFGDDVANPNGHNDGDSQNALETYEFTSGDYTLTLTGCSKVYQNAYDATGVSGIKIGTSGVVGTFTFEVGADVKSVVIRVAAYKLKASTVKINGTDYAIDVASYSSDNGSYMEITIDTTTVKTVTLSTVSGQTRVMIDSITYVI